ncbi:hypothetical protein ASD8599_03936 [Ascidiaceihabitans donghaensis]|uniref:Uncharacterized protein n=1 Tax=Ascidiaceihabitans donghaensis TaxID=1510460 RepID=A0A2R8BPK7_9RHOB|nr:hypothetical protein [Ascidiaceihabitans donghaensis]SPH27470.1 hypothetical protein ASD8599_03936 [Ascidiaceihabitans donghaensis]
MGREAALQDPNQRAGAGERVTCISGNCCDPATWPARWDMVCIRCIFCPDDADVMSYIRSNLKVLTYDRIYWEDPYFDGTRWGTRTIEGLGSADGNTITILSGKSCPEAADILYHETWHTHQPEDMLANAKELEAYTVTESWLIRKELPGTAEFRMVDSYGNTVPDPVAIQEFIDREYPGGTSDAPSMVPQSFQADPPMTEFYDYDKGEYVWLPSKEGDSLYGPQFTVGGGEIPADEFYCE